MAECVYEAIPTIVPPPRSIEITQNGDYNVDFLDSVTVNVSGGGGGGGGKAANDVNFFDYDGTIVESYSKEDFLALSAMPDNPSHDGLVAQGWNWSFTDAQNYVQEYGELNVGQMYTTDTGETKIYITLEPNTPNNRKTFYVRFQSSVANNVTIDWGDGTTPETAGGTTATNYPHTYTDNGDYVIKLKVNTGTIDLTGTTAAVIYGNVSNFYNRPRIQRVEIGDNVASIGLNTFLYCYSLVSVTIPNSVTGIAKNAFGYCYTLHHITIPNSATIIGESAFTDSYGIKTIAIPNSVTSIGLQAFYNCYGLEAITIPDSVTSIGDNAFSDCRSLKTLIIPDGVITLGQRVLNNAYSLTSLTVPDSVTTIGVVAFGNCNGMGEYHFLGTTPPSLGTNSFSNIQSDCKIYVPSASVNDYKTASNWSTYAAKIYGE